VLKYQKLLEGQQTKFAAQREADRCEVERLHTALSAAGDGNMTKLRTALTYLEDMPPLPKGVMTMDAVDEVLQEKEGRWHNAM
jgi:hypothetical protein